MPARKNQGLVNLMVLGLKHMEKDLLPLYNKEYSVVYVRQIFSSCCISDDESAIKHMRPGATKGTLRRENENSFFDVLCLITFHWSFKKKLAF